MPRIAKNSHVVEHKKEDGSILRARIELRAEGTYALGLRAFHRGRPTLKRPGELNGTKDFKIAQELARVEMAALAGEQAVSTDVALQGPMKQIETYLNSKRKSGRIRTEHTIINRPGFSGDSVV